jgi:hypothetical protein
MKSTTPQTIVAVMSVLSLADLACFRDESPESRAAAEYVEGADSPSDVGCGCSRDCSRAKRSFDVLGVCGEDGALNVRRFRGRKSVWAWRGAPSGGKPVREYHFDTRSDLRVALEHELLRDGPCSMLVVGYPAHRGWRFTVSLGPDGRVTAVKRTEVWQ